MKTFNTLSKKECSEAAIECFNHAEAKYQDALILANAGSYGNAISNLILCLEETMKGFVLSLDAEGFHFRHKVKGIKGLFENHKLRYFLGFILSCIHVIIADFILILTRFRENPKQAIKLLGRLIKNEKFLERYWIKVMEKLQVELDWFSQLDEKRQSGMYVGIKGKVVSPNMVSKSDFDDFIGRINTLRVINLLDAKSFKTSVDEFSAEDEEIRKTFKEEKYYSHIGNLISIINDRKSDSFMDLKNSLEELKNEIINPKISLINERK